MSMTTTFTVEQWEETYKPVVNHINPEASWATDDANGIMFETYGDEIVHVVNQANADERFVWTWVDGDDGTYIINGYHHVNRIGYFITEVPCVVSAMEIVVDKYEESEDDE